VFDEFVDHVTQAMGLTLADDVIGNAAGVLDILLPMQHLPDRARFWAGRVPHVHREDQRVAAGIAVEDRLGRRIGENAAVPVELAIDAHCWKRRRQCTRRRNVLDLDLGISAVEIAHHAGADVSGADHQARPALVDEPSCATARLRPMVAVAPKLR
jgi:hypothetical protein